LASHGGPEMALLFWSPLGAVLHFGGLLGDAILRA